MFPGPSTNNDSNTRSEGKISGDIIAIFAVLVTLIILPPFIIAGAFLYKNRRRTEKSSTLFDPMISAPIVDSHSLCYNDRSRAFRHVSLKTVPVSTVPKILKPLPQLPHQKTMIRSNLPSRAIPPRSSSLYPPLPNQHPNSQSRPRTQSNLPPRIPQPQVKPLSIPTSIPISIPPSIRPNPQAWRTSNPPLQFHDSSRNLTRNNPHDSIVSMISQSSSTYADVDLSDSIPNISPLSPPLSPRLQFHSVLHPPTPVLSGQASVDKSNSVPHVPYDLDSLAPNISLKPRHSRNKKRAQNQQKTSNTKQKYQDTITTERDSCSVPKMEMNNARESTWELRPLGTRVIRDMRRSGGMNSEINSERNKNECKHECEHKVKCDGNEENNNLKLSPSIIQVEELYFDFVKR